MSFFDDILGKLFPVNNKVGIREVLTRDQNFMNSYKEWAEMSEFKRLREDLLRSWEFKQRDLDPPLDFVTYISDYANGFTLYPGPEDNSISLSFLMEYIKEKLLKVSYRLVHATRKMEEKNENIEIIENYHLKPPVSDEIPYNQMYGNVEIEVIRHNQEGIRLKFLVSVYSDRKYTEPWEVQKLLHYLFDN
jgi:hypothetical protein